MQVQNTNLGMDDSALALSVQPGEAPMRVDSTGRVANLNADKLDGQEASDLAEPRGYAHVAVDGAFDPAYPSKGVNGGVIPTGETSVYCFDLAFTPKTAVGAPFVNNNAVVATVTPPNTTITSLCPDTHEDAAVRTFAANTSGETAIKFQIVFE